MRAAITILIWAMLATVAAAQSAPFTHLETADDSAGWMGVGRLEIDQRGFCTGALIAPDLVLTAAHCMYDSETRERIVPGRIEFRAGWRNGRAEAYRRVRRAVVHPGYVYTGAAGAERVSRDVALLELERPIRNTRVRPFRTGARPQKGAQVGVVSYAHDRAAAPALQDDCAVLARQSGVLVLSCDVDFGSSGAPVFSIGAEGPRIVSVVSAKAELGGDRVSLGTQLEEPLRLLRAALAAGEGTLIGPAPKSRTLGAGTRRETGAKFVRP